MGLKTRLALIGLGFAAQKLLGRHPEENLQGQVVLITGGSRGLGFLLAREFAREGCRVAICARDENELQEAQGELSRQGAEVLAVPCDVSDKEQVNGMVEQVTRHYGRVDILVNNAGVIQTGPFESLTLQDFEEAHNIIFWGTVYPTLAVVPQMRERRAGRVVNITSIGGKVSVPHLLPYGSAKFATVGFSEGLRAELAEDGVKVITIVPGLMRTGSFLNAYFKGQHEKEFTWFSLGDNIPFISIDAERAARRVVEATKRDEGEVILSVPANIGVWFHGLFPGLTSDLFALVNRFILPPGSNKTKERGEMARRNNDSPVLNSLISLGLSAAKRFNQHPETAPQVK